MDTICTTWVYGLKDSDRMAEEEEKEEILIFFNLNSLQNEEEERGTKKCRTCCAFLVAVLLLKGRLGIGGVIVPELLNCSVKHDGSQVNIAA
jgi:hypothetical protein